MSVERAIAKMLAEQAEAEKKSSVVESEEVSEDETVDEPVVEESEEVSEDETVAESAEEEEEEAEYKFDVDVSEDVEALVSGEDLSEEFKEKTAAIFEAAVVRSVKAELSKINSIYEERLNEEVEAITEGLIETVDGNLNLMVQTWMEEHEVALENGVRTEILESFVSGLKDLFEAHNIDIPEDKVDVLDEMEQEINGLSEELDKWREMNVSLNEELSAYKAREIISEAADGMTELDKGKFFDLTEDLDFDTEETFKKKVNTIRENYFNKKGSKKLIESVVSETEVQDLTEDTKYIDPAMRAYLSHLNTSKD